MCCGSQAVEMCERGPKQNFWGLCWNLCVSVCVYVTMGMREIFERNEMLSFILQFFVSPSRFIPTQQLQTGGDERSLHSSLV